MLRSLLLSLFEAVGHRFRFARHVGGKECFGLHDREGGTPSDAHAESKECENDELHHDEASCPSFGVSLDLVKRVIAMSSIV